MLKFIPSVDRYIFRLVIVPMLGIFALAASLLLLEKMLRLFDFVAVEGGPITVVFKMLRKLFVLVEQLGSIAPRTAIDTVLVIAATLVAAVTTTATAIVVIAIVIQGKSSC